MHKRQRKLAPIKHKELSKEQLSRNSYLTVERNKCGSKLETLTKMAISHGKNVEGHLGLPQFWRKRARFSDLMTLWNPSSYMEIGFNAGHSSALALSNSRNLERYLAFDIGVHPYVKPNFEWLKRQFPSVKHAELVIGDSTKTVPAKHQENLKFDFIHIDGGHQEGIAYLDLVNCKNYAHNKTLVIMDDCILHVNAQALPAHMHGPNNAVRKAINQGLMEEVCLGYVDCEHTVLRYM